jgi:hypothetical protein
MFKLLNINTGHFEYFTVEELLEVINRERHEYTLTIYTMQSTLKEVIEAIENFTVYTTHFKDK